MTDHIPSTHMSNVPSGGPNQGVPGTSMKADARTPTSPTNLPGNGSHAAVPKGSANVGPAATSTKSDSRSPLSG